MKRKAHFARFAVLLALVSAQLVFAAPVSVKGVVRNRAGVPQVGAQVQLLRADLSVAATVITDAQGRFLVTSVLPGRYSVKAICASYLPTLRENVRVRTGAVVNLTISTLYEAIQWLPAHPRRQDARDDDWTWTLRSAENRPLLRWLEDGPLVVVDEGHGGAPKLKARLMATGQAGAFGESGERFSATVEDTPTDSRELLARVDFAPNTDGAMKSMLGFRQDLGYAGAVQSVAALTLQPEVGSSDGQGLEAVALKTWENLRLDEALELEAGSAGVAARLHGSKNTMRTLPYAAVRWTGGNSTLQYSLTTSMPAQHSGDASDVSSWMPAVTVRNGALAFTRGLHQELGWERRTDATGLSFTVFSDHVENPPLEASARFASGDLDAVDGSALIDRAANLLRMAGPAYSTTGLTASLERRLPAGNRVRLSYANGDALVIPATTAPSSLAGLLTAARPRRAQTYTLALSGTLEGTGTRWRASYRWQPEDAVTAVAPFQADAISPYLNLRLRQPIRLRREGAAGFEFLLDVRNLLAEGYRPYLLNDGSVLVFAQDQRSFRSGVAFNF